MWYKRDIWCMGTCICTIKDLVKQSEFVRVYEHFCKKSNLRSDVVLIVKTHFTSQVF